MAEDFRWDGAHLELPLLDAVAADLGKSVKPGTAKFNFMMHAFIIRYFLGDDWFEKHVHLDAHPNSFLRPNFSGDRDVDPRYSVLILRLAELFINLQFALGFSKCLEHMSLEQIESGLAEMHVGQLFKERGIPFKYVEEADRTTVDIIFEAPDHTQALCEIKCKYEKTNFSKGTLQSAFREASRQIGRGNSGIVVVKVPSSWMNISQSRASEPPNIKIPQEIIDVTKDQIRQYSRIKKVVFVVSHYAYDPEWGLSATHTTMEFNNPKNAAPWDVELLNAYPPGDWYSIVALGKRWAKQA
ncbi:hypothetical protein [Phenylobacterium sp.]|uniref:hypothetical protein n=1 Tax=Phenylobacterium sp. TaxID=1871053 RepID=UPI003BA986C5